MNEPCSGRPVVCFSGHRPDKLPEGNFLRMMQSLLYAEILAAIGRGAREFYSGLQAGVDLWAADMVLMQRNLYPDIRLIGVSPFRGHEQSIRSKERYHLLSIMASADSIVHLGENGYFPGCYRARNAYMIERSTCLIAMAANPHSGTGQTIRMAERRGLDIRLISLERAIREKDSLPPYPG